MRTVKIAIIGAGAMGSLYGGLLSEAGHDVYLIDIRTDHIEAISQRGLYIESKDGTRIVRNIQAVTDPKKVGEVQLVFIFVKATETEKAIIQNQAVIGENTIVLTLQNGLGNIEKIQQIVPEKNILAGTTGHGATMIGPGVIRHAGEGKTVIGELDGKITDRLQKIYDLLHKAQFDVDISDNIIGALWDKLLVNAGINALTAITGLENGKILANKEIENILEEAVSEGVSVAKAKGIKLGYPDAVMHTKEVCKATAENKSSMLQDILNKRKTEVEMINGAIVREGRLLNIDTRINQILEALVLAKEKSY